jgi:hypothetical protein
MYDKERRKEQQVTINEFIELKELVLINAKRTEEMYDILKSFRILLYIIKIVGALSAVVVAIYGAWDAVVGHIKWIKS